ncbi:MAG TPA: hypothetical protein PKD66_09820, partial [Azonexus sp.]|nr:hypothetical protein [Azonexus sp.]
ASLCTNCTEIVGKSTIFQNSKTIRNSSTGKPVAYQPVKFDTKLLNKYIFYMLSTELLFSYSQ